MHTPHIGATALRVNVSGSDNLPSGTSAVSATASQSDHGFAITLINRHWDKPASVQIAGIQGTTSATGELLYADSPSAANSAAEPELVVPTALEVTRDGDYFRVELPPHAMATIVLR